MSQQGNPREGGRQIFNLWFNYFSDFYDKKWQKPIQLLTKKSGLKHLNKKAEYDAGLIWILMYDLVGAIGSGALKSSTLVDYFIEDLADKYDIKKEKLWNVFTKISCEVLPHGIFIEIYALLDRYAGEITIKDNEAIQGFIMFSRQIMDSSNLGYLIEHIGDLKKNLSS